MEILLNLIGSAALLLWGVRMIRTGIMRSFGAELRNLLAAAGERRVPAMASGIAVTFLLQSSMATALLVTSFAVRGAISGPVALSAILGADVGSTLVVQMFSQRIHWISPACIAVGVFGFLSTSRSAVRGLSRALLGLGLVMLALTLIGQAARPLAQSESLAAIVATLATERSLTLLLAVLVTLVLHSSIAAILMAAALAENGVIALGPSLIFVLGANIGSALLPLLSTVSAPAVVRRPLVANAAIRTLAVLVALPLMSTLEGWGAQLAMSPAQTMANMHMVFNIALALTAVAFVASIDAVSKQLIPDHKGGELEARPSHLDESAIGTPALALACASREALRIGDVVLTMLRSTMVVFRTNDSDLRSRIEAEDDEVDRHYEATKRYLARLSREELDRSEGDRSIEILSFTTNLEHIGDIIDKNLMELAGKKIRSKASFSEAGLKELELFHARVTANMELALNVFLTGDREMARRLLRQKIEIRDLERRSAERHFERIGAGQSESIDTSSLHVDVLRDLKRINSHLTAVAYPILEKAGELAESRLRSSTPVAPTDDPDRPGRTS